MFSKNLPKPRKRGELISPHLDMRKHSSTFRFRIIIPTEDHELDAYFKLRWQELRAPWNQPPGSEKDELDIQSDHRLAVTVCGQAAGVGRLHLLADGSGQIRYLAVAESFRRRGIAAALVATLEKTALEMSVQRIILQARSIAVPFYESQGYSVVEKTYVLYGEIQHYLMAKNLDSISPCPT